MALNGERNPFRIFRDYNPNRRVVRQDVFDNFSFTVCVIHLILIKYTIYDYIKTGQPVKCMQTISFFSLMITCYHIHLTSVTKAATEWHDLTNVGKYIYRDDNEENAYNRICSECIDESTLKYIVKAVLYGICFIAMCMGPINNLFKGVPENTLYYVQLPISFVDDKVSHFFNTAWQIFVVVFGFWGILGLEFMISMANNIITVSSKVTVLDIEELSNELENKSINKDQIRRKLQKIFDKIEYMDKYVRLFGNLMRGHISTTPFIFMFSITTAMHVHHMSGLMSGYWIVAARYIQLLVLSYTGKNIFDRNERLRKALFDFKWHLLPNKDQTDFMHLLFRSRNEGKLRMSFFHQMTYQIFRIITERVIYTIVFVVFFYFQDIEQ